MAKGRASGSSKGSPIQCPFTGGSWRKTTIRSMNSTGQQFQLAQGTIFHRGPEWNTIRDTTPPMSLTRTGIPSKPCIKAKGGTSHRQGRGAAGPMCSRSRKGGLASGGSMQERGGCLVDTLIVPVTASNSPGQEVHSSRRRMRFRLSFWLEMYMTEVVEMRSICALFI